jgi:putative ABC transport system substrate-binding protein
MQRPHSRPFSAAVDPVEAGVVASLNRPGGNVTGVSTLNVQLGAKRLGLLQQLVPSALRFAMLLNPSNSAAGSAIADMRAAASTIGRQIEVFTAATDRDIDSAFASLVQKQAEALLVSPDSLFANRRVQLVSLAARHAMPAIYSARDYAEVGGLMTYGPSFDDLARLVGVYTGRILKGEKPADLPVMLPTKYELAINLQTARLLGIAVPPALLAQADEVIE